MKKILCTVLTFCLLAGVFTTPCYASETASAQAVTTEKILETAHGIYDSDSATEEATCCHRNYFA